MKILESKFFKKSTFLTYNEDSRKIESQKSDKGYWNITNSPYSSLLGSIMADIRYFQSDTLIIYEKYLKDFVKCTDFTSFRYSK